MTPANRLPPAGTIRIGVEETNRRAGVRDWQVAPPFGPGYVVVVASERPLYEGTRQLEEPLRQLSENAGLEGSVVVNKTREAQKGWGVDFSQDGLEMVDLVKSGIIDPAMVTRSALQNAASIAKNILVTEAIVAEAPEKGGASMGGGMPDMGGMGGMM